MSPDLAAGRPLRVLFVNHTAVMSGAEYSLMDLLARFPPGSTPFLATPKGPLYEAARSAGIAVHVIPGTEGSLRAHPTRTLRALGEIWRAARAVRGVARQVRADVVAGNSVRAGLIAGLASRLGAPPAVVHVRDALPGGTFASVVRRVLARWTLAALPNSGYTAAALMHGSIDLPVRVVHNAIDLSQFDPDRVLGRDAARARLGIDAGQQVMSVIAQITPWKAQDDAIRTLARMRRDGHDTRLLVVGAVKFAGRTTRFDNRAFEAGLSRLIRELGVEEAVSMLGHRDDIPEVLAATDVLLAPSWEEPFGRTVIEAMAMRVPVIATCIGGPAEILRDGIDGLLLSPRQPEAWAAVAEALFLQPEKMKEMGRCGRERVAARFDVAHKVGQVLAVYRDALDGTLSGDGVASDGEEPAAAAAAEARAPARVAVAAVPDRTRAERGPSGLV